MKAYLTNSTLSAFATPRLQMVGNLIALIREANELLQQEEDLSPNNDVVTKMIDHLSQQLRVSYLPEEIQLVLNDEYIRMNQQKLQDKLSEVEFLAELADAYHICNSRSFVLKSLIELPTWNIYKTLVGQELSLLSQYKRSDEDAERLPMIFVGSGPMPLSSILLHQLSEAKVTCLEMNDVAYDASSSLIQHLGLEDKVEVVLGNGAEFDYSSYRQIFVASLVRNKREVLQQIMNTSTNPLVAVRTAEGIRQIRYEAIDETQLDRQGWGIMGRTIPTQDLVINSTLFLRREHKV